MTREEWISHAEQVTGLRPSETPRETWNEAIKKHLEQCPDCPSCAARRVTKAEERKKRPKPPSLSTMERWMEEGVARAVDGCRVEPDGHCPHGSPSWLIELGLI
jgi:hypothetical protein